MLLDRKATRWMAGVYLCAAGALGSGCNEGKRAPITEVVRDEPASSPGFALTLPDGALIETIDYSITGDSIVPLTGTVSVTAAGATLSALIRAIPEGNDYLITLAATTSDGKSACVGSSNFDVVAGRTTDIPVNLVCRTRADAESLRVDAGIFRCPTRTADAPCVADDAVDAGN